MVHESGKINCLKHEPESEAWWHIPHLSAQYSVVYTRKNIELRPMNYIISKGNKIHHRTFGWKGALRSCLMSQRHGSVVKNTGCSSEDPDLLPSTTYCLTTICSSNSREWESVIQLSSTIREGEVLFSGGSRHFSFTWRHLLCI